MVTSHTTIVPLYSNEAGTFKKDVLPLELTVMYGVLSSVNGDPLTSQSITPVVTLQLKVAIDPSVALTDVGMLRNAAIWKQHS